MVDIAADTEVAVGIEVAADSTAVAGCNTAVADRRNKAVAGEGQKGQQEQVHPMKAQIQQHLP